MITDKGIPEEKKAEQKAEKERKVSGSREASDALSAFLSLLQTTGNGQISSQAFPADVLREGAAVLGNQLFQKSLGSGAARGLCKRPPADLFSEKDLPVNLIRTDVPALISPAERRRIAFGTAPEGIFADPFAITDREERWNG